MDSERRVRLRCADLMVAGIISYIKRLFVGVHGGRSETVRVASEPRSLAWTPMPTVGLDRLLALHDGRLAVSRPRERSSSRLLTRDGERWRVIAEVEDDLRQLRELSDGSLIAGGPRVCMHGQPDRMRRVAHDSPEVFHSVWGPSAQCAYGLSEAGLFHFDGDHWRRLDLEAQGVQWRREPGDNGPMSWNAGICDSTGRSWIVGNDMKHSTLATGIGGSWERAGRSGIGALTHLAAGADGTLFVVGFGSTSGLWPLGRPSHRAFAPQRGHFEMREDPRWPTYGGSWRGIDGYLSGPSYPLAIRCHDATNGARTAVIAVARSWDPGEVSHTLPVFLDDHWEDVALPRPCILSRVALDVTRDGRLTLATAEGLFESARL